MTTKQLFIEPSFRLSNPKLALDSLIWRKGQDSIRRTNPNFYHALSNAWRKGQDMDVTRYARSIRTLGSHPVLFLSKKTTKMTLRAISLVFLAEGTGFEPAILSYAGFQDQCHQPLGHPSVR